ncbi:uncharacterized protein BCR38DRAFT_441314 [Pseudomassariella vexata]|uniref:CFEM domain-containing protein n=1 Tax=Pseudomassariella vexata TaxID=1141098 RepID=A0A1Y2DMN7_9PEZI|nr:uncharacterized protein BCR38DRAFT_441314 [Pseudomassariella vexata]ORY60510.1 hypothetical protein BCR38DRAFT_441314 [Pseudomassariella vexata]
MRSTTFVAFSLANLLLLATTLNGVNIEPSSCATRCMVDSMFITQCQNMACLCREIHYQKSLYQCLNSQCDSYDYGHALFHTIGLYVATGADIYMKASPQVHDKLLDVREAEYLASRELPEVSGLKLRQKSAGPGRQGVCQISMITQYVTTTAVVSATRVVSPLSAEGDPGPYGNGGGSEISLVPTNSCSESSFTNVMETALASRPWVVSGNDAIRYRPSFAGLATCGAAMIALDWHINAF